MRLGARRAVAFEDRPCVVGTGSPSGGPYPANGVVIYNSNGTKYPNAGEETCTLPEAQHSTCADVLDDFLGRYPLYHYPA